MSPTGRLQHFCPHTTLLLWPPVSSLVRPPSDMAMVAFSQEHNQVTSSTTAYHGCYNSAKSWITKSNQSDHLSSHLTIWLASLLVAHLQNGQV